MNLIDQIRDALARDDGSERSVLREHGGELIAALACVPVLAELDRLYRWRFELAAREKRDREHSQIGALSLETKRLLAQYGAEKKAAWEQSALVLAAARNEQETP